MSELLDKIKEVQSQVNNCSSLEAKQLLEQVGGDVDLAVALFEEAHPEPVAPVAPVNPAPQPQQSAPSPQPRPEPPHQDPPPRRRRRFWWIPLVAVSGYLVIMGLVVLVMYQVTDGFSSFGSTYSYSYRKSSSTYKYSSTNKGASSQTCTYYSKPSKSSCIEYVCGSVMPSSGYFSPITSGTTQYAEIPASDYNNAFYDWTASLGLWCIQVENVTVRLKSSSTLITGQLWSSGTVDCSGNKHCNELRIGEYTFI